jgi:gluconolactonase
VSGSETTIEVRDPRAAELVDPAAELEPLADGLGFAEGPVWVPRDGGYLLFSDVPRSRRLRWDERSGCREIAGDTGLGNGMTLDGELRLLVCEGERGRLTRMHPDGTGRDVEVLTDGYRGRRLNSPNDVIAAADGSLLFTDSWWPHMLGRGLERELDFQGVYRIAPGGEPELLLDDLDFPNGLCFAPGGRQLYVNDSTPGRIDVFDLDAGGRLGARRMLIDGVRDPVGEPDTGHVDGMKCDALGNVWVTGPGGVWIIDPGGTVLAVIRTPRRAGNLHWGGPHWRWLFIGATSHLYRLRTRVGAGPEPFMLVNQPIG